MATEKESKKMNEKTEVNVQALLVTDLKQSQTVLNLDTLDDGSITLVYKKFDRNEKAPITAQLAAAMKLVGSDEKRVEALLKYATSEEYQNAKTKSLAAGNFLTTQLKSRIVGIMQTLPQFDDVKAADCYARWLAGYKAKKESAIKLLDRAKASEEFADL